MRRGFMAGVWKIEFERGKLSWPLCTETARAG